MLKIGKLKVTKMHGLGNTYAVIEDLRGKLSKYYKFLAKKISDPIYGLSTDGILVINKGKKTKYRMRIFNPDGSEAEMCGNGVRIFAKYLYEKGFIKDKQFVLETYDGSLMVGVKLKVARGRVKSIRVNLGEGRVLGKETIKIGGKTFTGTKINVGNPHFVIFLTKTSAEICKKFGPLIENHKKFQPSRTNVEFAEVINRRRIKVFVWERGAGFTLACGTGASATALAGYVENKVDKNVIIEFPGGEFKIYLEDSNIFLESGAEYIFEGIFYVQNVVGD